jgi:hypothetical protein
MGELPERKLNNRIINLSPRRIERMPSYMNTGTAIRINRIRKTITVLSDDQLNEVEKLLKKIAPPSDTKNIMKLKGIWKGKGFETINIEKEIQGIRKEVIQGIERRDI